MGFARATEDFIRQTKGMPKDSKLDTSDKVIASAVGGALGVWNMPLEVIRVEMQSMKKLPDGTARPQKLTMLSTLKYIYKGELVAFTRFVIPSAHRPSRSLLLGAVASPTFFAYPRLLTVSFRPTENGIKGLFRGVTPRIGLGVWRVSRPLASPTSSPS